ncbi:lipoprotein-releasing system ATP-binding protein LolD [Thalassobaculum fulvum]|jgi:lipoprotein-releasing system ATP-binding protein|uniref:Lipoprotein-releasing system ATP-binding protein LolD n=1 Tax=Thalassobaculum fulvum TaxID=1633335 RepID=A0A918XQ74_9PROT|nr:ABC transporter ATP-binding protein [Thalassobaculum fulvum]GHD46696.1 lipoprotein-releasing system ATP-binding protein LolD [Thalassobaculum fulvum]
MNNDPVLRLEGVTRRFGSGETALEILRGVDFCLRPGELVALVGPSGAGKSTLLHIAGLLEAPTSGKVLVDGKDCAGLGDAGRTRLRRDTIGFVYQFHHLLPEFSARENVMIPQMVAGLSRDEAGQRADQLLKMVGLERRSSHRPARLSGGEQQRVAIVRAIANVPQVLLADEPTGNLDPQTAAEVFGQLTRIVRATGLAALIATHNLDLAAAMDRTLELKDGVVLERRG